MGKQREPPFTLEAFIETPSQSLGYSPSYNLLYNFPGKTTLSQFCFSFSFIIAWALTGYAKTSFSAHHALISHFSVQILFSRCMYITVYSIGISSCPHVSFFSIGRLDFRVATHMLRGCATLSLLADVRLSIHIQYMRYCTSNTVQPESGHHTCFCVNN